MSAGELDARRGLELGEWRRRKSVGDWKPGMISRSVRYGEVAKVIDGIKGAGAQPVGLQIDELPR